jgi:cytochrome c556
MRLAVPLVALAWLYAAPAAAHDHATGVVKEPMEAMKDMARHMKAIGERMKSGRDLAAIKVEAKAVQALAVHVTHLFPPGSTQKPTDAKPTIWQNWADFETKANALADASANLANAESSDRARLSTQVRALSDTCGACHELYRSKH